MSCFSGIRCRIVSPFFLLLAAGLLLAACSRPPIIDNIEFSRQPVPPSDTVTITAVAHSPMGDSLMYHWSVVRGSSISPVVGDPVVFTSSKVTGHDTVALYVQDNHERVIWDTFAVWVASPGK